MRRRIVVLMGVALLIVASAPVIYGDGGHKSVGTAQLLSWVILPGAGQWYAGEPGRGALVLAGTAIVASATENVYVALGCCLWAGFDAGKVANKHNEQLPNRGLVLMPLIDPVNRSGGLAMVRSF